MYDANPVDISDPDIMALDGLRAVAESRWAKVIRAAVHEYLRLWGGVEDGVEYQRRLPA